MSRSTFTPPSFRPSHFSYGGESLGDADDPEQLGFVAAVIGGATALVTSVAGGIAQGQQAKQQRAESQKQREHELAVLAQQTELARLQTAQANELARLQTAQAKMRSAGTVAAMQWLGGSLLVVGLVGSGAYLVVRSRRSA